MMRKKRKLKARNKGKRVAFSLLELCLSLSVMGIIASLLTWQTRDMFLGHQVQEGMKTLMIDLRQMQSLALSHRTDFEITFHYDKAGKEWYYSCTTDEPIPLYSKRYRGSLKGVKLVEVNGRSADEFALSIYSSGRIAPSEALTFKGRKHHFELDFSNSPQIALLDKMQG